MDAAEGKLSSIQSHMESLGFVINNAVARFQPDACSTENPSDENMDFTVLDEDDTLSFVVLGKNSLELIRESSMASYMDIQQKSTSIDYGSMISSMNSDDIHKKLTELLQENSKLKETLRQNNTAMKHQINTLASWQEDIMKVHDIHKKKFAETTELIKYLKKENNDLKMKLSMEQSQYPEAEYNNFDTGLRSLPKVSFSNVSNPENKSGEPSCNRKGGPSASYVAVHERLENNPAKESIVDVQCNAAVHEYQPSCTKDEEISTLKQRVNSLEDQLKHATTPVQFCVRSSSNVTEYHKQRTRNMREYVEMLQQVNDFFYMHFHRASLTAIHMEKVLQTVELILDHLTTNFSKCEYCSILDTTVLQACKDKLAVCYKTILEAQKELMKDQEIATKSQYRFKKVLSDYESTLHELEEMMEENSKMDTSRGNEENLRKTGENLVQKPADTDQLLEPEKQRLAQQRQAIEREKQLLSKQKEDLDLQYKTLNEAKEYFQQEKISLNEQKMSLDQQSQLYENLENTLRLEKETLEIKCRGLTDETERLRAQVQQQEEELYLLKTQAEVYEEDFRQEVKVKCRLLEDRNGLVSDLQKQMEINKLLQDKIFALAPKRQGAS